MSDTITFYDNHIPALSDGAYSIQFSQKIQVNDSSSPSPEIPSQTLNFFVSGPRFLLETSMIHSVYPPSGGKGDYRSSLPSLVLNRSTLPWERSALLNSTKIFPWLFLLLIDESESNMVTELNNVALTALQSFFISDTNGQPPLTTEDLTRLPSKINYLELDASLLSLIPDTASDLQYLSYARIKAASDHTSAEERAVLLCNRLPQPGHNSTVYLVSLENNYSGNDTASTFTGIKNSEGKLILPYLYKWDFHASDDKLYCLSDANQAKINQTLRQSNPPKSAVDLSSLFDTLFTDTDTFLAALSALTPPISDTATQNIIVQGAELPGSTFDGLLSNLAGGFSAFAVANSGIQRTGTIRMPFQQMQQTTPAWFRGPITATSIKLTSIDSNFPMITNGDKVRSPLSSQELMIKDTVNNIPDATYASAFELGRLTALNDAGFSTEFFKWKNETATALRLAQLQNTTGYKNIMHLSIADVPQVRPIPAHVLDKFTSWKNLENIPYRYLVPDAALLPNESIRFFQLDNNWINAFICGAFSIGHTVEADLSGQLQQLFLNANDVVTGFLINSLAVSGWPDFMVNAVAADGQSEISLLRRDNLDVNVRLYLLSGKISQLEFYLHPAKTRSGFVMKGTTFTKKNGTVQVIPNDNYTLALRDLVSKLDALSVADFASKMLEGIPTVVFTINE